MKDHLKTKEQLVAELSELRNRIADLESPEGTKHNFNPGHRASENLPEKTSHNMEFTASPTIKEEREMILRGAERDISEHEKAVRSSEERQQYLERVLAAAPDAIVTLDAQHHIVEWNPGAERLFGYSREEVVGKNLDHIVTNRETYEEATGFTHMVFSAEEMPPTETVRFRKDGTPVSVIAAGSPILIVDELLGIVAIYTDISELKKAKEALKKSKEKYRNLVETIDEILWEVDRKGIYTYISPKIRDLLGYEPNELRGKSFADIMPADEGEKIGRIFEKMVEGKSPIVSLENIVIHKDGHPVTMETSAVPFFDNDGSLIGYRGIDRDITKRKILETQLRQTQKMEAIGTLAGGIAHDFNNLLMGIQGRASLMLLDVDSSHPHYEHLKQQEEIIRSGANLTKKLLGFAEGGKYEVKPADINELVVKTSDVFGRAKKEIVILHKLQTGIWTTEVDQGQIEQSFMILYVNAWQAMPEGGTIEIETKNVILDDNFVRPYTVKTGSYVQISIRDTGVGMDEATKQRIFEPFFTTKEMGRGTGLGLASVYGIIKNHHGYIDVVSEKGHGSTSIIYLPAPIRKTEREEMFGNEKIVTGSGTILLIDDEQMILDVSGKILDTLGYTVLLAKSGKEGLEIFRNNQDTIDLVSLDIIMPGMSGGEVFDKIKEIKADARVLLASGYSINEQAHDILERGCDGFIQKPFSIEELSNKIKEIMEI